MSKSGLFWIQNLLLSFKSHSDHNIKTTDRWSSRYNAMFCWEALGPGIHVNTNWLTPPIQTQLWTKDTPSRQLYSAVTALTYNENCSGTSWGTQRSWKCWRGLQIPQIPSSQAPVGWAWTSLIHGSPTPHIHDPKRDPLQTTAQSLFFSGLMLIPTIRNWGDWKERFRTDIHLQ